MPNFTPGYNSSIMLFTYLSTNSTTKMVTSWKDPTTISSSQINKILFISLIKDEPYSNMMEDHLVAMSNGKGIASHTIIAGRATTENYKRHLIRGSNQTTLTWW